MLQIQETAPMMLKVMNVLYFIPPTPAITGANVGTLNVSTVSINTNGGALDLTGVGAPTVSIVLGGTSTNCATDPTTACCPLTTIGSPTAAPYLTGNPGPIVLPRDGGRTVPS